MKKLNKNGIQKAMAYLGHQSLTESVENDVYSGLLSMRDIANLAKIDVLTEKVDGGYHFHLMEQDDLDDVGNEGEVREPQSPDEAGSAVKEMDRKTLEQMVVQLSEFFPTKEEINQTLNDFKASMIDPEEWIDILNMQKKMLGKSSKSTDTVG